MITPHVGGGFGSKGGAWGHLVITALAAKMTNRPVKLALTRQNMFNSVGLSHVNFNPWKRVFATTFAVIITAANVSFPVMVLAGVIH